jgi:hypothetical protein
MLPDLYNLETNEEDYLYIKPSQIPNAGLGLYTAIKLFKGDIIAQFHGEVLNKQEFLKRSALQEDNYFMNLPNGLTLDCMNTDGFAKMANDVLHSNFKQNAIITLDHNRVVLVANKTIQVNNEILTSYGKKYWETKID